MSFWEVTLFLLDGFWISLLIFAVTLLCGAPLGLPIAFCSMSRFKLLKSISKVIVWIVRGVPLMLQIFIIYYVPGLLFDKPIFSQMDRFFFTNYGIQDAGRIIAVLIAFSLNYACYFSEIYRGGIESIPQGQYEAGERFNRLNEYDRAIECFHCAYDAQKAPRKMDMMYSLAFLYKKLGRFGEAKKEWELIAKTLISDYGMDEEDNDITWAKDEIAQLERLLSGK